jgi:uncharacterized repeat protein (TIGR04042 family)
MPEMHFRVTWPDGSDTRCYSPSLVIKDFFVPGTTYPLADFLTRSREAYGIASERVRQKYGFPCSLAARALAEVEGMGGRFPADAAVTVDAFEE